MRKVTVHIVLTAVLLGAAVPQSLAATGEPGGSATAISPDTLDTLPPEPGSVDTLPPEPGSAGDTRTNPAGNPAGTVSATPGAGSSSGNTAGTGTSGTKSSAFRGKYFGGKFGINNSSASGTTDAPSASTLAYGMQGGYLQGGYNWDLRIMVVGVGAYVDWNNYTIHSNAIAYASRSYGLDAKLGLPVDDWLPYVKVGYGYSTGTRDVNLRTVAQNSFNGAVGVEYNFAPRWSAIAEYKKDHFSNRDGSITITNRLFTFGFNYYFDIPLADIAEAAAPVIDLAIPAPILQPDAIPDAPPAP